MDIIKQTYIFGEKIYAYSTSYYQKNHQILIKIFSKLCKFLAQKKIKN